MLRWVALLACTSLIGAQPLDPAQAQHVVDPQAVTALAAAPEIDPDLLETLELSPHDQRMAVPVMIGDNDGYRFVIDTGAERTVISRELADRLALGAGPRINLVSLSGRSQVATVAIPALRFGRKRDPKQVMAPALSYRHLGASGLLGVDLLEGHKVLIDVDRRTMQVRPSRRSTRASMGRNSPNEIIVRAASRLGQLIVTDADYRGKRIRVVIDTGSGMSIGNMAMRRLIGARGTPLGSIPITSVTGQQVMAEYHQVDRFRLGGMQMTNAPMAFGDLEPFRTLGLDDAPAMLLGMDAFRMFRRVDIDFANRDIRFELRSEGVGLRMM
jgi:predicted aspartyl protease